MREFRVDLISGIVSRGMFQEATPYDPHRNEPRLWPFVATKCVAT